MCSAYAYSAARIQPPPISEEDSDTDGDHVAEQSLYTAAVSLAQSSPKVTYHVSSTTAQFVVLSFDGSKSVGMLKETLDFGEKMRNEQKPLHFTYFINAAYFLTSATAPRYQPPEHERGVSSIGFSNNARDIPQRMQGFNEAYVQGHEIGSHSVGHFNGSGWSYDDWMQEFNSFSFLMSQVQENNQTVKIEDPLFLSSIHGFRAPSLGVNRNLYSVLSDMGFTYDSSGVGRMDSWPTRDTNGVWHIPLGSIFFGPEHRPGVAMDYSIWMHQSNARETALRGSEEWQHDFAEVEDAYMNYFNTNYKGSRAPIVIGHHFSKWNDGVYWEAMKSFAEQVCGQPHVRCVTFKELVEYLNSYGTPEVIH